MALGVGECIVVRRRLWMHGQAYAHGLTLNKPHEFARAENHTSASFKLCLLCSCEPFNLAECFTSHTVHSVQWFERQFWRHMQCHLLNEFPNFGIKLISMFSEEYHHRRIAQWLLRVKSMLGWKTSFYEQSANLCARICKQLLNVFEHSDGLGGIVSAGNETIQFGRKLRDQCLRAPVFL